MGEQSLKIRTVVVITVVGMRCGDLVSDAIGRGHAAHGDRSFPGLRSVIYFRKNMRVNVDHDCWNTSGPAGCACFDLSRFVEKEKGGKHHRGKGTIPVVPRSIDSIV